MIKNNLALVVENRKTQLQTQKANISMK